MIPTPTLKPPPPSAGLSASVLKPRLLTPKAQGVSQLIGILQEDVGQLVDAGLG